MKRNILYLQTTLLFLLLLTIIFGLFLIAVPLAPGFKEYALNFINSRDSFLITCGSLLIVVALLLLTVAYSASRGVGFTVTMGEKSAYSVNEKVLNSLVKDYFKKIFHKCEAVAQFVDNQIVINLQMPPMPFIEQKPLLEKMERELVELFEEQFDYSEPFSLSATVVEEEK